MSTENKEHSDLVRRLELTPANVSLGLDQKVFFTAVAYDRNNQQQIGVRPIWRALHTADKKKAIISQDGAFIAGQPGEFTISAKVGRIRAEAKVTVQGGTLRDLKLKPITTTEVSSADTRTPTAPRFPTMIPMAARATNWDDNNIGTAFYPENNRGYKSYGSQKSMLNPPPPNNAVHVHNPGSNNYSFTVPVVNLPGRGLSLSLSLVYNSLVWHFVPTEFVGYYTAYFDIDSDWPAPGWSLGFGKLITTWWGQGMLMDNDGTRHPYKGQLDTYDWGTEFRAQTTDGSFISYSFAVVNPNTIVAATANYPDGTIVEYSALGHEEAASSAEPGIAYPTRIIDRNGNYITITYRNNQGPEIETITDTVGRVIQFNYDMNNRLIAISGPNYSPDLSLPHLIHFPIVPSPHTFVRLHYQRKTIEAGFDVDAAYDGNKLITASSQTISRELIDAIYFPNGADGTGYWFGETDFGKTDSDSDSISSYGMICKVNRQRVMKCSTTSLTDQGAITPGEMIRQQVYNYPMKPVTAFGGYSLKTAPEYSQLEDTSWEGQSFNTVKTIFTKTIAAPIHASYVTYNDHVETTYLFDRNMQLPIKESWKDGLPYQIDISSGGKVLRRTSIEWEEGHLAPRRKRVEVTDEIGQTLRMEYVYGPYFNQVIEVREYDYDGFTLLRRVVTDYFQPQSYINRHILNLVSSVKVFEGNSSIPTSLTNYIYDLPGLIDAPRVVAHLDSHDPKSPNFQIDTNFRGNVCAVQSFADPAQQTIGVQKKEFVYDITGNVVQMVCSNCEQTNITFDGSTQYSLPTAIQRGDPTLGPAYQVKTQASYDIYSGLKTSDTDADGLITEYVYDSHLWRLAKTHWPTGATTEYIYDDANLSVTETIKDQTTALAAQSVRQYDGLGLVVQQKSLRDGGAWNIVDQQYDFRGRLLRQSRPYQIGPALNWSEIVYDALGRVVRQIAPDGSAIKAFYNVYLLSGVVPQPGTRVLSIDAWGRQRYTRLNALGRLVEVVEPEQSGDLSNSSANHSTFYRYDVLGNLVEVIQGSAGPIRKFQYDGLGRLTHQFLPEKSPTLDDNGQYNQNGGTWSDVFFYDGHSNLVTHVDARGIRKVLDYAGDPLNRLQSISFDMSRFGDINNPVSQAPKVTYDYMSSGDVTRLKKITTDGICTEEFDYDNLARLKSKIVTFSNQPKSPLQIDYALDNLNRLDAVQYPAEYDRPGTPRRLVQFPRSVGGLPISVFVDGAVYASQAIYGASDNMMSLKVGLPGALQITELYDYDLATGLLERQRIQRNNMDEILLDQTYEYLLPGATAGRTGQLTRLINNLDYTQDRSYTYDGLGRLARVYAGDLNLPAWVQEYSYDAYGNRTGVSFLGPTPLPFPGPIHQLRIPVRMIGQPAEVLDGASHLTFDSQTNHITSPGFSYDAAGNQTATIRPDGTKQTYQYDAAGRLVAVLQNGAVMETYFYGSDNRRLGVTKGQLNKERTTYFVWDGNSLLATYDESTVVLKRRVSRKFSWNKSYIYLGIRLLATLESNEVRYYHPDRLGTRLISQAGNAAVVEQTTLPFGTLPSSVLGDPGGRLFTSYERSNATGLDYAINRTYDSYQGRFIQIDPLELQVVNLLDPQSLNPYSYTKNDPVNTLDPAGLDTIEKSKGSITCYYYDNGYYYCRNEAGQSVASGTTEQLFGENAEGKSWKEIFETLDKWYKRFEKAKKAVKEGLEIAEDIKEIQAAEADPNMSKPEQGAIWLDKSLKWLPRLTGIAPLLELNDWYLNYISQNGRETLKRGLPLARDQRDRTANVGVNGQLQELANDPTGK